MSYNPGYSTLSHMHQELVRERIRTLHHEAAQERMANRVRSLQKARRQVERASLRLMHALARV
jgi:hypothetical protein